MNGTSCFSILNLIEIGTQILVLSNKTLYVILGPKMDSANVAPQHSFSLPKTNIFCATETHTYFISTKQHFPNS